VDEVEPGATEDLGRSKPFGERQAALRPLGDSDAYREVYAASNGHPDRAYELHEEAKSLLEAPAPAVAAPIRARGEEL
jgi:hypothetical protein